MKDFDTIESRIAHADVTAEEMLAERGRILAEHSLMLDSVFDTFSNESGRKDVVLARTVDHQKVIVRLGERRPSWLFADGFVGTSIRFPRQIAHGGERIPYEIEEMIDGTMMIELDRARESVGKLSDTTLQKLAAAFWEFQSVAASLPLEPMYSLEKAEKFIATLDSDLASSIRPIAEQHRGFFETLYPSKWKFATDNLILDAKRRVAFIDNVKVGNRYFGYDIGWIIWPSWLHMSTEAYADVDGHLQYLEHVKAIFFSDIPDGIAHPADLDRAFTPIIFERIVGALFDIKNRTKHLASAGLDATNLDRLNAHKHFLKAMLTKIF